MDRQQQDEKFKRDRQQQIEKFKRHEADFRQYLLNKYFSDKTIDGEDIYDQEVNIDGKTVKASRKPPYQSYLDDKTFSFLKDMKVPGPSEKAAGAGPSTSPEKGKSKAKTSLEKGKSKAGTLPKKGKSKTK